MDTNIIQKDYDVIKETVCILNHFEHNFLEKIPHSFLEKLNELSLNSNKEVFIDTSKKLKDQDVSNDCKDLISFIYYKYVATSKEKNQIISIWKNNENKFQKELHNKYNPQKLFSSQEKNNVEVLEKQIKSESLLIMPIENTFKKIINFIKKFFNY